MSAILNTLLSYSLIIFIAKVRKALNAFAQNAAESLERFDFEFGFFFVSESIKTPMSERETNETRKEKKLS